MKQYNIKIVEHNIVQRLHSAPLGSATVNSATINSPTIKSASLEVHCQIVKH